MYLDQATPPNPENKWTEKGLKKITQTQSTAPTELCNITAYPFI
jgi:hypothetical protein